ASSILFVVGRSDTGDLEAQIRGSRHAWDVRLISVDSLFRLVVLKESVDNPQIIQQICEILIPKEFTRLDHIVDIVFLAAEDAKEESDEVEILPDQIEVDPSKEAFVGSERKPFTRSRVSVKFNEACAERFGRVKNVALKRKTKTMYEAEEHN